MAGKLLPAIIRRAAVKIQRGRCVSRYANGLDEQTREQPGTMPGSFCVTIIQVNVRTFVLLL
jgi:hypothetical protein